MADVRSGLDPKDYRFINMNPDPDFSPERNKAIVDETIKEANEYHRKYTLALGDAWEERKDIMSHYAIRTLNYGNKKSIVDYIGRKAYETLIGEKILSKVRIAETSNRLSGNTHLKKGILL